VAEARAAWRVRQAGLDPHKLLFIDETWAKTNMTRLRGRAPAGERLVEKVPHGHWKTSTLIAALDCRGMRCSMMVDGAVNADVFEAFVVQVLVPSLEPGDVVVMDNLSSHKTPGVQRLIESAGARLLYLPPYSPDLNPIELAFSKIKHRLRSLAYRISDQLWTHMQQVLEQISTSDAMNFFRHCGYSLESK
jgi:transposase